MSCFKTVHTEEARTFQKIVFSFLIDATKPATASIHKHEFILLTFLHDPGLKKVDI